MKIKIPSPAEVQQFIQRYAMPLPALRNFLSIYFALRDPLTPVLAKVSFAAAVAYTLLPADAIPDFLPGGLVDDAGVLIATLASAASIYIREDHRRRADKVIARMRSGIRNLMHVASDDSDGDN